MASPLADILRSLEPERRTIEDMEERFAELIREYDVRARKKNYSQRLSDALARRLVADLGRSFPGIEAGERRAGGRERPIRVDVRWHTSYGLGLGISVKTLNFRDGKSGRFTKNLQRIDKELNAEAGDLHGFQPRAVLAALLLMPEEARTDGAKGRSSFDHALDVFRKRVGRAGEVQAAERFELFFLGTYAADAARYGDVVLHDLEGFRSGDPVPPDRTWEDFLEAIRRACEQRFSMRLTR
jgi:hypothetical protein